jgi:hypothetical protein
LAPAGRVELPPGRAQHDVAGLIGEARRRAAEPERREQSRADGRAEGFRRPPPQERNGRQATNYQR